MPKNELCYSYQNNGFAASGESNLRAHLYSSLRAGFPVAQVTSLFSPHPNLGDDVNHNLVQSEIEGGVFLKDLPTASVLQIETQHRCYTAVLVDEGSAL